MAASVAWSYPVGFFYDDALENLLEKIGLEVKKEYPSQNIEDRDKKRIVFVASHIYDTGGHSRTLVNCVKALRKDDKLVRLTLYITNANNHPTSARSVTNEIRKYNVKLRTLDWFEFYSSRIQELYNCLIADNLDIVILFIHPNDVISIAAIYPFKRRLSRSNVIFFNHADHVFWLGKKAIDLVIEHRATGAKISYEK